MPPCAAELMAVPLCTSPLGNTTSVKHSELQTKFQQELELTQWDRRQLAMATAAKVFVC